MRIGELTLTLPNTIPNLSIGSVNLEISDITLVILIYVGIAFTVTSISSELALREGKSREMPLENLMGILFRFHLYAFLILLWVVIFGSLEEFSVALRVGGGWLFGLATLFIVWQSIKSDSSLGGSLKMLAFKLLTISAVILLILLPGWALLERSVSQLSWSTALTVSLEIGTLGIIVSFIYWLLIALWVIFGSWIAHIIFGVGLPKNV